MRGIDLRDQNTANYDQTKRTKLYASAFTSEEWYQIIKEGTSQDKDGLFQVKKIRNLVKKYREVLENSVNIGKWLAGAVNYDPSAYADIDAVVADNTIMNAIANDADVLK